MSKEKDRRTLSGAGLRVTQQRALLLEIIRQGKGHLDAYELYRQARERQPDISLSTVYRALQKFKQLGLVDEVHFDEAHHHYEVKPPSEHHHLVCLGCGRVIEFHYPLSRRVKRSVSEAKDFDIVDTEVRMTGYCDQCRQKERKAEKK
jgi:Fur family ferric uptake transcriptional regulator